MFLFSVKVKTLCLETNPTGNIYHLGHFLLDKNIFLRLSIKNGIRRITKEIVLYFKGANEHHGIGKHEQFFVSVPCTNKQNEC